MFKKRGRFNKSSSDTTNDTNLQNSIEQEDKDATELELLETLPKRVKKTSKTHKITFRKKTIPEPTVVNNLNTEFNEWYLQDEQSRGNSYYDQFDETDELIFKRIPKISNKYDRHSNDSNLSVLVHRLTPPFLNSSKILSTNAQIIDVIKDKSGDLYKASKNGSAILMEKRKINDRKKQAKENVLQKSGIDKVTNAFFKTDDNSDLEQTDEQESEDLISASSQNKSKMSLSKKADLPAYKVRSQLLDLINENQVIIVIGETGSGKTTQLPQILYEAGYQKTGLIGITQPRRMAAVSVATRVSEEMNVKLGNEVGFTIRFNDHTSDLTNIKFMTDGVLLRETLNDSTLNKYSCIIMDEAHERSLNTDILFGIFKKLLTKRRDFKLIVTSATMNSLKFSKFFNNAIQFKIPGKTYPVEIMYQSVPSVDYIDSAVKQALKIHLSNSDNGGDILIFMTGQEDIEITCELIHEELNDLKKINDDILDLDVLPVYSTLSSNMQSKIFKDSKNRKCIVATNIAETSLTLKHVKFVIDTGLMKLKVYNPKLNMDSLQVVPISKAQANQRSGRAGRTSPGQSFRLYTLSTFEDEMWDEPIPEIQRSNLMNTILLLKNLNIKDIDKFQFIDKPSIESIETSQYELWSIGALDNFGNLTNLGRKMSQFPIDPMLSKLIIISNNKKFRCSVEVIKIVAMLSVPNIFIRSKNDSALQKRADKIRENFQIGDSDHLTLLNIFNQFQNLQSKGKNKEEWCSKNFFNFKSLRSALEVHDQLLQLFEKTLNKGNVVSSCQDNWDIVKECLCASFYSNAAEFFKNGQYKHLRTGLEMNLHPTCTLNGIGDLPKYVIFHELIMTGKKQYMNYVTAIDPKWLVLYGSVFYSMRVRGVSSRENQLQKQEEFNKLIEFEKLKGNN